MHRQHSHALAIAVVVTLAGSAAAHAQEAATPGQGTTAGGLEEVVVTAQKRVESIQDVPLSVAAVSGETLRRANVTSVLEVQKLVPNLIVTRSAQTANVRLNIRGIGAAGNTAVDPSIGTFVDGVYVPRPGSLFAAFNDLAGIEVLRGPQGTLFGRNSTVGGLLFRTASPSLDALEGNVAAEFGSYGRQRYSGMINVPANDRLAFRAAAVEDSIDGWAKNRYDGETYGQRDTTGVRLGMAWDLTDALSWTVKFDYSDIRGDGAIEQELMPETITAAARTRLNQLFNNNPPDLEDPFDQRSNQRVIGDLDDEQWGVVNDLAWESEGGYTVRLLAGYRDWQNDQFESDVLFMPSDLVRRNGAYDSTSQSYELQFISPVDKLFGGRLDYVAGLYYFQEDFFIGEVLGFGANYCTTLVPVAQRPACVASPNKSNATDLRFDQDATNYAVYAQGNLGITDTVDLVLGARWTKDEKEGSFVQLRNNPFAAALRAPENTPLDKDDDELTYRVGLNWMPGDDLLLFTSYSTGYKSGGFNSGGGAVPLGQKRVFDKETAENLELGVKSTLFDGALRLNATLFRMDLNDFQDRSFDGTSFVVRNAGNLRHQGLEFDGELRASDNIRLFAAAAYLDSEFTDYDTAPCLPYPAGVNPLCTQNLKGERAAFAPEWQGSVGLQLEGDIGDGGGLGYEFRTDLSYMGDLQVGGTTDNNPQTQQSSYALLSARYTMLFGSERRWSLSIFGENLTDVGFCGNKFYQTLDNTFQMRDPVTGGTGVRCVVGPPRSIGVGFRYVY